VKQERKQPRRFVIKKQFDIWEANFQGESKYYTIHNPSRTESKRPSVMPADTIQIPISSIIRSQLNEERRPGCKPSSLIYPQTPGQEQERKEKWCREEGEGKGKGKVQHQI
jgi:hypothetical protein